MQRTLDEDPDPERVGVMWGTPRPRTVSSARGPRQRRGLPTPASFTAGALAAGRALFSGDLPVPRSAPVHLGGARLDAVYPRPFPFEGQALDITLTSNADNLDFGLVACRRAVPDLDRLVSHLDNGLAELEKAST
ncbi:WS/DGAT domain-containing protein [Nocardia gipuzkoensis]|uniref:WS/DGAT domain-containing protein n=1 Tax=Nocardia gipuzkoensis TaxID=2749991 RepID=UPI003EDFEB63